ncbi:MAG: glutamate--cysteine ligase [Aestuariivita sp.]|nr:glutamate--cysteine ligase [Aestuariivita sp.]
MSIPQSGGGPVERYEQLAEYIESGCKPQQDWRIGTEHEKFGYCKDTLKPLPYDGEQSIVAILEGLRMRHGWQPLHEGDKLIGLQKDNANISLEPGGQLELSGAPLETIHETCDEVNSHLDEVKDIADQINAGFIGLGAAPIWKHEDVPMMPKGRYKLMDAYMQKVGSMGRAMMRRTCTVQVNLDFSSETDMVKKLRVAFSLQPVATALFANSPFFEGRPIKYKSWRSHIWRHLDADRTGMLSFIFEDGFGFERWVDYAINVPMYFVYRDGHYVDALGQSFRDFMNKELPALPGQMPTLNDWADHLTTIFPEARIKKFIEMRGADGGPWRRLCALPAFWVGLIYNQTALDAAYDLTKNWSQETREALQKSASIHGLQAEIEGIKLLELSHQVLEIAEFGLVARGKTGVGGLVQDETHFLNALKESVETGKTPADDLLHHYYCDWNEDLMSIYDAYSY